MSRYANQCVFCGVLHDASETQVECSLNHEFIPAGPCVMLAQIVDDKAIVSIHDDVTNEQLAGIMTAFMDKISEFEHVRSDPSAIMQAMMKGATNG